ncbi:hypothetical protein F4780DRAFT_187691 [Xylariomycetidae sp. FL0641]|nr:hypothetical protein F4780DRAFT_187691 [Xylariomycetidae sp. FL0641]
MNRPAPVTGGGNISPRVRQEAEIIRRHFERSRSYVFEGLIGAGSQGATFKIKRNGPPSLAAPATPTRRYVLKRALEERGYPKLQEEINILRRLRGSMHIARTIDENRDFGLVQTVEQLSLRGPKLLLEWIENGLFHDFLEKLSERREKPLPNRLLWKIFLCLCRMVVGMTWPASRGGSGGIPRDLEVLPTQDAQGAYPAQWGLVHADLHASNIMIGHLEPYEHRSLPILKLIDFGKATIREQRLEEPDNAAASANIFAIGKVMLRVVGGGETGGSAPMSITVNQEQRTIRSLARDLDGLNPIYRASADRRAKHQTKLANLDGDIRSLVARCVATDVQDRITIEELLPVVEANAAGRGPGYYTGILYEAEETDEAIQSLTRRTMMEADTHPPPNVPVANDPPTFTF